LVASDGVLIRDASVIEGMVSITLEATS
jgi:hypothetical protein